MTDQNNTKSVEVTLQRIYLKDLSFESPAAPQVFREQFQPKIQMDIQAQNTKLEKNVYEVSLGLTLTAKTENDTVFIIEVEQAGIFSIKDSDDHTLQQILNIYCPTTLFPYVRETVDALAIRGSLPPLMLAPINFEALYHQQMTQK